MKADKTLSSLTTDFQNDEIVLGIDEAGRGPVLGPMVYACAYWSINNQKSIVSKLKFDDSKKLKPEERSRLFEEIKKYDNIIRYETDPIQPEKLSRLMLQRDRTSLNQIAYESAARLLVKVLSKGVNLTKIIVDTIGDEKKYKDFLRAKISKLAKDISKIEIKVEKKADANHKCVSAASIVAKVTRDTIIDTWNYKEIGESFTSSTGSGYPSDPYTKEWLQKNFDETFGYPSFVRFSWKTVDEIFKEKDCKCEWEDYDEKAEEEKRKNQYKNKNKGNQNQPNIIDTFQKQSIQSNYYKDKKMSFDIDI